MTEVEKSINDIALSVSNNTKDIADIKGEISEIKEKQDAIYKLSTSVEVIANNMTNMKEDISKLKEGQDDMTTTFTGKMQEIESQMTAIENKPLIKTQGRVDALQEKIMWLIFGGVISGLLYLLIPYFHG